MGDEEQDISNLFKELDTDNDGSLSIAELEQACSRMGMSTCTIALQQFRKVWVERSGVEKDRDYLTLVRIFFNWISHSHLFNKLKIYTTFMFIYIYAHSRNARTTGGV